MTKYDYDDLRDDIDRWSAAELSDLDRWEKRQWKKHDADPQAGPPDAISDAAGGYLLRSTGIRDRMLDLVSAAQAAEEAGDPAKAEALVGEVNTHLATTNIPAPPPRRGARSSGTRYDPRPLVMSDLSLLGADVRDYASLRAAIDRWQEHEERSAASQADAQPETSDADTFGDGGGIRLRLIEARADQFREQIDTAEALDHQGETVRAGELTADLRRELGITDEAAPEIETYLIAAARKAAFRRRMLMTAWAVLTFTCVIAAAYILGS